MRMLDAWQKTSQSWASIVWKYFFNMQNNYTQYKWLKLSNATFPIFRRWGIEEKKLGDNLNKKTKNVYIIARLTANANFATVPAGFNPASSYTYFGIADGRRWYTVE